MKSTIKTVNRPILKARNGYAVVTTPMLIALTSGIITILIVNQAAFFIKIRNNMVTKSLLSSYSAALSAEYLSLTSVCYEDPLGCDEEEITNKSFDKADGILDYLKEAYNYDDVSVIKEGDPIKLGKKFEIGMKVNHKYKIPVVEKEFPLESSAVNTMVFKHK